MENFFKEKTDYQKYIIDYLVKNNGYIERNASLNYNQSFAMDPELLIKFIETTQPKTIEYLRSVYSDADNLIIKKINDSITKKDSCLINKLKYGVYFDNVTHIDLVYTKPETTYDDDLIEKYNNNIFSVMEEVYHTDGERIDLVIFLNGIAIITIELKSNQSGQNYKDAIIQYKNDRDYKSRLLSFKNGSIVNFAMDTKEVYMCTQLKGKSSFFLPFNKGTSTGDAGNPHNENGLNVSYMWEDILTKDTLLMILDDFIFIEKEEKEDPNTGKYKIKESLIFPRYHQLDAIRKIINDCKQFRTKKNYLIEHSAGSGKTKTIAWLAYKLQSLHDLNNVNIFDSVIIITDRIVVDQQLQEAIKALDHDPGLIKVLDETCISADLSKAIMSKYKIIVSTIQKFRFILEEAKNIKDKNFAIIIDEAHSSTSGKNMAAVTTALANKIEIDENSIEDLINDELKKYGKQENISMFAFTATPKKQTLQLFGTTNEEGMLVPFHLYGMKQAIQEGFILDVLTNYTTYKTFYNVSKNIEDNPEVFKSTIKRKINWLVNLDEHNIGQKVSIIIEHFRSCIMRELGGKAKAMVVTSSREAAVRYKIAFEKYILDHGYNDIKALVAFSGNVEIDDKTYSEVSINKIPEKSLTKEFDKDIYQVLLVADKYQTGFDQPKLVAMYIDKKLHGIAAVQTLSRLNRICPPYDKKTFILDFKNDYEDIKKAFEPYYNGTILAETISPESIYNLSDLIDSYNIIDYGDIEEFNEIAYKENKNYTDKIRMETLIDKALSKIKLKDEKTKLEIKKNIGSFNKNYRFLIQATIFEDIYLHKKFNYLSVLYKEIDVTGIKIDFSIVGAIKISSITQQKIGEYNLKKGSKILTGNSTLQYVNPSPIKIEEEKLKRLDEVIKEINMEKGTNMDSELVFESLNQIKNMLLNNDDLLNSALIDSYDDFKFPFYKCVDSTLVKGYNHNKDLYKLLLDDDEIKTRLLGMYMKDIYKSLKKKNCTKR